MRSVDAPLANAGEDLASVRLWLAQGLDELVLCSSHLLAGERKDPELASSAAFNYLMLMGTVIGGWQLARGALTATAALESDATDPVFLRTQVLMARFYAEHVMPRALAYGVAVRAGSGDDHGAHRRAVLSARMSGRASHWSPLAAVAGARAAGICCPGWPSRECSPRGSVRCAVRRWCSAGWAGCGKRRCPPPCANGCRSTTSDCLLRDVEFCVNGERLVFAQTVLPASTLARYPWLRELGDSPLGEALRRVDEPLEREPLEYAELPAEHPLARAARRRRGSACCGRDVRCTGSAACRSSCRKSSCPNCCACRPRPARITRTTP